MLKIGDILIAKKDISGRILNRTYVMEGHRYKVVYIDNKTFGIENEYGFFQQFDKSYLSSTSNKYTFDNERLVRMRKIKSLYK